MTRIATTWGITGPQFLWLYGALAAALAATAAVVRKRVLGPRDGSNDPTPHAMPNMVKNERSLCAHKMLSTCPIVSNAILIRG